MNPLIYMGPRQWICVGVSARQPKGWIFWHYVEAKKSTFRGELSFKRLECTAGLPVATIFVFITKTIFCQNLDKMNLHVYFILKLAANFFGNLALTLPFRLSFQNVTEFGFKTNICIVGVFWIRQEVAFPIIFGIQLFQHCTKIWSDFACSRCFATMRLDPRN